jgi:hypothetical protein
MEIFLPQSPLKLLDLGLSSLELLILLEERPTQ